MNSEKIIYIGIDIHRLNHYAAILTADNVTKQKPLKKIPMVIIGNNILDYNRLEKLIQKYRGQTGSVKIAIDQTGRYSEPLTNFLQQKNYQLYYVSIKAVKAVRKYLLKEENKNDVSDAIKFAYLLYLKDSYNLEFGVNRIVPQLDNQATLIRNLVLQYLTLTKLIVQLVNKIRQLLHLVFPEGEKRYFTDLIKIIGEYPTPADILQARHDNAILKIGHSKQILDAAKTTVGIPGDIYREIIMHLAHMHNESLEKKESTLKKIKNEIDIHPYGKILLSFPMLGYAGAAILISVIKDINNWTDDRALKKAFNVYPISLQSGKSMMRYEPGKEGDRIVRGILTSTVMSCISPFARENDMRDYYLRLTHRGKPKQKALVSTAGKTTEIIYHCLKYGKSYQYQGTYKLKKSGSTEHNQA